MKSFTRSGHEELHGTITGRASARFESTGSQMKGSLIRNDPYYSRVSRAVLLLHRNRSQCTKKGKATAQISWVQSSSFPTQPQRRGSESSIGAFARHGWISCYYTLYYDLLSCVCDVKDRYIFSALQKMGTQTQNHRRLLIRSIPFRPLCYGAIYVVECEAEH
ncbi:hypothetical protein BHM03_00037963 [Ensete ventricosum]|nr:hypothetical protein BHM03_00037963 [Ensete ventricosum]